jgi:thiamine biosynthesis lipoprotein ApbE
MKYQALPRLALVSILALAGCTTERSPEQLVTQQVSVMQELGEVLSRVTDRASAEQHKSAVERIVKQMNSLRRELQGLSEAETKALMELGAELSPARRAAQDKLQSELKRIEPSTDIQKVLGPWLDML